jgi:hypothetical protein
MTHVSNPSIEAALATARVRSWRLGLVSVHKALIDAERQRYERLHGRIPTPHDALRLVIHDPWFDWLRPLAELIVRLDERLADQTRLERAEVRTIAVEIHVLLRAGRPSRFGHEYRRTLQEVPDVVVAHGRLLALIERSGDRREPTRFNPGPTVH